MNGVRCSVSSARCSGLFCSGFCWVQSAASCFVWCFVRRRLFCCGLLFGILLGHAERLDFCSAFCSDMLLWLLFCSCSVFSERWLNGAERMFCSARLFGLNGRSCSVNGVHVQPCLTHNPPANFCVSVKHNPPEIFPPVRPTEKIPSGRPKNFRPSDRPKNFRPTARKISVRPTENFPSVRPSENFPSVRPKIFRPSVVRASVRPSIRPSVRLSVRPSASVRL